jgi:hypothetical protein
VGAGEAEEFGAVGLRIPHTGYRVQGGGWFALCLVLLGLDSNSLLWVPNVL